MTKQVQESNKQTPVLDKVQGKMAGVLKEENWPDPRDGEMTRKRERNETAKVCRVVFIQKC